MASSVLEKDHYAVAFHQVTEAIAARMIGFCYFETQINVADVLNKPNPYSLFG